jgi:serine/threonine-protein kinase
MMEPSRYELLAEIASGDFAVVYRGRDRELGREVAIKQIHQQYLNDSRTLERFWREAQLLASLEHRNIMTIYDMVRSRGWLILELMPASLQKYAQGEPLDLDLLRVALSCSLQALQYLHANNIIHGDIKPSNLFVDKRLWVKVGDFGLARRASNEQGSMLKGTTRYMAPELVSQQFGPVGPASDLYSLGFSAYELMCGSQFDALFPGMDAFGRDKQIAWMMWHAAPDRRMPPINRVLAGVPDDLRHVIEKLSAKDPAQRYRTAAEALADLKSRLQLADTSDEDQETEEELAAAAKQQRRKRLLGIALAALLSCVAVLALLVFKPAPKPVAVKPLADPIKGVVRNVLTDRDRLVIEKLPDRAPEEYRLTADDHVLLNGAQSLLRDLREGDQVTVKEARDESGKLIHEFFADRPDRSGGTIASVDVDDDSLTLELNKAEKSGRKALKVAVPPDLPIRFNNQDQWQGKPVKLADLLPGDRVSVDHEGAGDDRKATSLSVTRVVPLEGYVRAIDSAKGELTIAASKDDKSPEVWPLSPKCKITINGEEFIDGAKVKLADVKPDNEVTIQHDTHVVEIAVQRTFHRSGVIQTVSAGKGTFTILCEGQDHPTTHSLAKDCKIRLGDEPVQLVDLGRGDDATISFDSVDSENAEVLSIAAARRPDPTKWALVVGEQAFDDKALSLLPYAGADARLVAQTLTRRFQVPPDQSLQLVDEIKARWEVTVPAFLEKIPADARLLVYYVGHAYADKADKIWLAPKDFVLAKAEATGIGLNWFVELLEKSPAREKLLLLDATHSGAGSDEKQEPSSAEMIQTLQQPGAPSPLRTVTAIASCKAGERGQDAREKNHGRFALSLAEGLSGRADKDQDNRIDPSELYEFLVASLSGGPAPQTPFLFLPDNTPPRLTEEARTAIRKLAANLLVPRFDAKKVEEEYSAAQKLAEKEPEPKLIYGLVLAKGKHDAGALQVFDDLKADQPKHLLPPMGAAYVRFHKQDFSSGMVDILQLVNKLGPAAEAADEGKFAAKVAEWAGRMREFSGTGASEQRRPPSTLLEQVDTAARQLPEPLRRSYDQGRAHVQKLILAVDRQIADTGDQTEQLRLQVKRKQLTEYVVFPFEFLGRKVLDGMQDAGPPRR